MSMRRLQNRDDTKRGGSCGWRTFMVGDNERKRIPDLARGASCSRETCVSRIDARLHEEAHREYETRKQHTAEHH
jgi:hypothetical protein